MRGFYETEEYMVQKEMLKLNTIRDAMAQGKPQPVGNLTWYEWLKIYESSISFFLKMQTREEKVQL